MESANVDETKALESSKSDSLNSSSTSSSSSSETTSNKTISTQFIDTQHQLISETNASSHQPPPHEHTSSSYGVTVVQQQHNSQPSFTSSTNLTSNSGYQPSQVSGRIVYLQNAMPSGYYQNINGKLLLKLNCNRFVKIFQP
jgi:hypothetical protein